MQSKYIRTIGIVLAVILSMAAIFYIGGLVNQFNLNYQKWLAEGGITGKATMDAICFSPVCCWRSAMTASGLKCVALVAVIGSGVYLFIHFQDRFGNGDYDPRNFSRSKRGTYGTAGVDERQGDACHPGDQQPRPCEGDYLRQDGERSRHLSAGGYPAQ